MTTGPILRQIATFGLPIFIGNVFQQLYSMVDSIVVGNYVGTDALAAVGSASIVSWCLVMLSAGLTTGASVVVSQLFGAGRKAEIRKAISTTLIIAALAAVLVSTVGLVFAPTIMSWVNVPEQLMADSVAYLRIYCAGAIFLMLYNFFASVLRALGDSVTPLVFLIISSLLNIFGDLYFVLQLHLDVPGVALATVLSQAVSVILCAIHCLRKVDYFRFEKGEFGFYRNLAGDILRMGVPSAIQSGIGSLGFVVVQGLINSFDAAAMAAYTAASKMEGLAHLPVESFGMSLSVFAGQNIGAGDTDRVRKGLRRTILLCIVICLATSVVIFAVGPWLISLFLQEGAEDIAELGAAFMRIWAPLAVFFALMNCINGTLRGAGDSVFVMSNSFFDLGVRTIMAFVFARSFGLGFMGVAYAIFCGWIAASLAGFIRYCTGKWKTKAIAQE